MTDASFTILGGKKHNRHTKLKLVKVCGSIKLCPMEVRDEMQFEPKI